MRTEAFVTVVVPESRIARRARNVGGGVEGRGRVLALLMAEVEAQLRGGMGFSEVAWLTSPELAVAVRTGFAPADRASNRHRPGRTGHRPSGERVRAVVPGRTLRG